MRRWCPATLKDVFRIDIPIVRHAQEVNYLHHLSRLVWLVDVASEYRGLDLFLLEGPIGEFYLVKDADAWWREPKRENGNGTAHGIFDSSGGTA